MQFSRIINFCFLLGVAGSVCAHIVQVTHLESKETGQHVVLLADLHAGEPMLDAQQFAELTKFFTTIDTGSPVVLEFVDECTEKMLSDFCDFCHISPYMSAFTKSLQEKVLVRLLYAALNAKRPGKIVALDARKRLHTLMALPTDLCIAQANRSAEEMDVLYRAFFGVSPESTFPAYIASQIESALDAYGAQPQVARAREQIAPLIQRLKQVKRLEDVTDGFVSNLFMCAQFLGAALAPLFDSDCVEALVASTAPVSYLIAGSAHTENIEKMLGARGFVQTSQKRMTKDESVFAAGPGPDFVSAFPLLFTPDFGFFTVMAEASARAAARARDKKDLADKYYEALEQLADKCPMVHGVIASRVPEADLFPQAEDVAVDKTGFGFADSLSAGDAARSVLPVLEKIKAEIDGAGVLKKK